jgi:enoyl-CoA hydratase/carnithine racemase
VVPREKLIKVAEEMARTIASHDPIAVRYAKQAVMRGLDLSLAEGLELEKRLASQLSASRGEGK